MRPQARIVILLLSAASLALTACGGGVGAQVEPATDRPTFVWIFSDP